MAIKKNTYISVDLEWAESKLQEWKDYINANPFHQLKDRIEWKPTSKGGMLPMVIATIESQIKCVRDTMKEYLAMLDRSQAQLLHGDVVVKSMEELEHMVEL